MNIRNGSLSDYRRNSLLNNAIGVNNTADATINSPLIPRTLPESCDVVESCIRSTCDHLKSAAVSVENFHKLQLAMLCLGCILAIASSVKEITNANAAASSQPLYKNDVSSIQSPNIVGHSALMLSSLLRPRFFNKLVGSCLTAMLASGGILTYGIKQSQETGSAEILVSTIIFSVAIILRVTGDFIEKHFKEKHIVIPQLKAYLFSRTSAYSFLIASMVIIIIDTSNKLKSDNRELISTDITTLASATFFIIGSLFGFGESVRAECNAQSSSDEVIVPNN